MSLSFSIVHIVNLVQLKLRWRCLGKEKDLRCCAFSLSWHCQPTELLCTVCYDWNTPCRSIPTASLQCHEQALQLWVAARAAATEAKRGHVAVRIHGGTRANSIMLCRLQSVQEIGMRQTVRASRARGKLLPTWHRQEPKQPDAEWKSSWQRDETIAKGFGGANTAGGISEQRLHASLTMRRVFAEDAGCAALKFALGTTCDLEISKRSGSEECVPHLSQFARRRHPNLHAMRLHGPSVGCWVTSPTQVCERTASACAQVHMWIMIYIFQNGIKSWAPIPWALAHFHARAICKHYTDLVIFGTDNIFSFKARTTRSSTCNSWQLPHADTHEDTAAHDSAHGAYRALHRHGDFSDHI